jgi:hypothetical protein
MNNDRRALEELARRLSDEREIVTFLLYKLTVTHLMLAADERRFVPEALDEVEQAVALLREGELRRDAALRELADVWSTDPAGLTLEVLARRSPPPFDHIFADHLASFRELAAEVEHTAGENRVLATSDLQVVTGQLDQLTGSRTTTPTTYDAHGQLDASAGVGARLREAL